MYLSKYVIIVFLKIKLWKLKKPKITPTLQFNKLESNSICRWTYGNVVKDKYKGLEEVTQSGTH